MSFLLTGVIIGFVGGIFFGLYVGHFTLAVQTTAIGFGAGVGIFVLGALVRYVAELAEKAFGRIKEGKP